jgi:enoyl-CoA hydratase/carnithine racemase
MPVASIEVHDRTAVLRLATEQNLWDTGFVADVSAALDEVEAADALGSLVTIGSTKCFSNGFDLEHVLGLGDGADAFLVAADRLVTRVLTFPKPTVAALNGHTFGIGAVFALAHDQRVARADRGWFCLPEVDLGLHLRPMWNALVRTRLPDATALQAVTTAHRFDGPSAVVGGIAVSAHAEDELLPAALALAEARAGKLPAMVQALKRDLYADVLAALG